MPGIHKVHSKFQLLLDCIECRRHDEAKLIIKENLANAQDSRGRLLHHTVYYNNQVIARNLIALGTDVDFIGKNGMTPLMIAVQLGHLETVVVLLEADANIDLKNAYGKSALQMVFELNYDKWQIIEAFFLRVKIDSSTVEQLAERLLIAGCTLHHAVLVKNMKVSKALLNRGMNINSPNRNGETALHIASQANDLIFVEWLIHNAADVNVLDNDLEGPLYKAVRYGNIEVVQFLLERAADPNSSNELTPLLVSILRGNCDDSQRYDKCVQLLLQHGAVFPLSGSDSSTFFKFVFTHGSTRQLHCLIARLAMLDFMGITPDMESIVRYSKNNSKTFEVNKYFEQCQQQLKIKVFQGLTLFDLLTISNCQMKLYLRNKTFVFTIENFCRERELEKIYTYYYNTLKKCIDEATRVMNLENETISIISGLFDENNNVGYIAAKKVVSYLNVHEIENVTKV